MQFIVENIVLIAIALVSGAMLLWPLLMRGSAGPTVDTHGATRLINDTDAVILDVRPETEFAAGHLPNARNIPLSDLDKRAGELPAGKPVLVCCASGVSSGKASALLRRNGRGEVFNLAGGLQAWRQAGLPVVK
ncbi:MAG TPA: rhodanese-like domain-containing protein [Burkholderiaceae bacterium]|nr:rhodanese-like domain-containing protein [Burkholderiaceae bacterium]